MNKIFFWIIFSLSIFSLVLQRIFMAVTPLWLDVVLIGFGAIGLIVAIAITQNAKEK
jgi:hypothetical protein